MSKSIKWGIIGLGKIAHKFAQDLTIVNNASLHAVASRNKENAKIFARLYSAKNYYNSYQELVNNTDIDVVYIATPHALHYQHTIMALNAGKAVLCEKAFALNALQVKKMINTAKNQNLFLMEALWTRFIPATKKVLNLINSGCIGEVKLIEANFGFNAPVDKDKRLYNKNLGGGALLDIGIYPILLSLLTLGKPDEIIASACFSDTQIDTINGIVFKYNSGKIATLNSSIVSFSPVEAIIHGQKGYIKMHTPFHHTKLISVGIENDVKNYSIDYIGHGYCYEIEEVNMCLINNKKESELLPLSLSVDLINILDNIRSKIGLTFSSKYK